MPRKYDASRREQAARRTRDEIVAAAFRLHGLGITDYERLAEEANVSVPTIRKHFPTREDLFQHCTAFGMHSTELPDLEQLEAEPDAAVRTSLAVRQLCGAYESLLGQVWMAYLLREQSPTLASAIRDLEAMRDRVVELALQPWQPPGDDPADVSGLVTGLLSYLTYRALRCDGGLSPEEARAQISEMVLRRLEILRHPPTETVATR